MTQVDTALWTQSGAAPPALPGAGATLRQVHIKAGHSAPRHSHPHEQFLMVLSGAGQIDCETGPITLQPGCVIRFAPGAWHSALFTEATVLAEFNLVEKTQ